MSAARRAVAANIHTYLGKRYVAQRAVAVGARMGSVILVQTG